MPFQLLSKKACSIFLPISLSFFMLAIVTYTFAQNTLTTLGLPSSTPAAGAFSMRKLSTSYTGFAIQVRRSSDNTLQNIGFTASGDLDTAALKSFVTTNSGFVATWYDQSGNGRNAAQASSAAQPRIINGGVIDYQNGRPALLFSGTQNLQTGVTGVLATTSGNISTAMLVFRTSVANGSVFGNGGASNNRYNLHAPWSDGSTYWQVGDAGTTGNLSGITSWTSLSVGAFQRNNTSANIWKNGASISSSTSMGTSVTATTNIWIGSFDGTSGFIAGSVSELIFFPSALSTANRQLVECNQSGYYAIAENIAPVITCAPNVALNVATGSCVSAATAITAPTATDNCSGAPVGAGLQFNGTSDYISFTNDLSTVTNFTYEAWINQTANNFWQRILDFGRAPGQNIFFTTYNSFNPAVGFPRFVINLGTGEQMVTSTTALPLNQWVHLAVTLDGSTARLYMNGTLVGTTTGFTYTPSSLGATTNNWIGRSQYAADGYYVGRLDDVRMWNVTRTQAEIQANMNMEIAPQAGLIAYYRMNNGTIEGNNAGKTRLFDYSCNSRNGTLNSFALTGNNSNYVNGAAITSSSTLGVFNNINNSCILNQTFTPGTTNISWTAYDASGNTSTCVQTVTVTDNIVPTITCPANISTSAGAGSCTASVAVPNATTADNCAVTRLTWEMTGATTATSAATGINNIGTYIFSAGVTSVTYTVADAANNTAICTFTVTVTETTPPTINCPANASGTVAAGTCTAIVTTADPVTADNCSSVSTLTWRMTGATLDSSGTTGINNVGTFEFNIGTTIVTYTATDASNNATSCSFVVRVNDNVAPTITCSGGVLASLPSGSSTASILIPPPTVSDNCTSGSVLNFAGANQSVIIPDNSTLRLTGDITVEAWFRVTALAGDWVRVVGKGDITNRNYGLWYHPNGTWLFQCYGAAGTSQAQLNAPVALNTWYQIVGVKSGTTYKLYLNGVLAASTTGIATPYTNADPLTIGGSNFHTRHIGQIDNVRVWNTALNDAQVACSYNGLITGNTANLIAHYNMEAGSNATTLRDLTANGFNGTLSGGMSAASWSDQNAPVGSLFLSNNYSNRTCDTFSLNLGVGTWPVIWTATDLSGNSSNCTVNVVITDSINPVITCLGNVNGNASSGSCSGSVVTSNPTTSDNLSVAKVTWTMTGATIASSPATGMNYIGTYTFNVGTTTVTYTAADASNNTASCSFVVTVADVTPPVLTCSATVNAVATAGTCSATVTVPGPAVIDNCAGTGNSITFAGATQHISIPDNPALRINGDMTVEAWFRMTSTPTDWVRIVGKGDNTNRNYGLWYHPSGRWLFQCYGASGSSEASFNMAGALNTWYHIVGVKSGTTYKLFINGVLRNTITGIATPYTSSDPLTLGGAVTYHTTLNGQIDNVRLWNTALTDAQVACSFTGLITGNRTNLIAHYNMESGVGSRTVRDVSGNGYHGTLSLGMPLSAWTNTNSPVGGIFLTNNIANSCNANGVYPVGNTTVTWTATDLAGNSSTCTQIVRVADTIRPTVSCPANITSAAGAGVCTASVGTTNPVTADNCSVTRLTWAMTGATIASSSATGINNVGTYTFNTGVTTVTYTSADSTGNTGTCSFTVTVTENVAPVITCPSNISTVTNGGLCSGSVVVPNTVTSDNCSVTRLTWAMTGATVATSATTGINNIGTYTFNRGVTTVTYTAADPSNNISTCTFTVTLADNTAPVITCPANIVAGTGAAAATCAGSVVVPNPVTTDNCGIISSLTWVMTGATTGSSAATGINNVGTYTFNRGVTTIAYTVTDPSGNSSNCSFTVTVNDNTVPVISGCPSNRTVPVGLMVQEDFETGATGWSVNTTETDPALGRFLGRFGGSGGAQAVSKTFTMPGTAKKTVSFDLYRLDSWDGEAFVIYINDVAVASYNPLASASGSTATVTWSSSIVRQITPNAFSGWADHLVRVVLDINDANATCKVGFGCRLDQGITDESYGIDNFNIIYSGGGCSTSLTFASPVATDNCTLSSLTWAASGATVGASPATGINYFNSYSFNSGITTVTYTATDASGNTNTCSFNVTATPMAPVIVCPGDLTSVVGTVFNEDFYTGANGWTPNVSETDNSVGRILGRFGGSAGAQAVSKTFVVPGTARKTVGFDLYRFDSWDNENFRVYINDVAVATFNPLTASSSGTTGSVSWTANVVRTITPNAFAGWGDNVVRVILTINDGNPTCKIGFGCFLDQSIDDESYAIDNLSIQYADVPPCSVRLPIANPAITTSCGIASLTWTMTGATTASSPTTGINYVGTSTFYSGFTTLTYTVTDVNGAVTSCESTIAVKDNFAPTITCPASVTTNTTSTSCTTMVNAGSPITSDDCAVARLTWVMTGATVASSPTTGINNVGNYPFNIGTTTITYTVSDGGNTATCTQTVTVVDVTAPVLSCPANITVNNSPGVCGAVVNYTVTATENCAVWQNSPATIPGFTVVGMYNGNTYYKSTSSVVWPTAKANAIAMGGHLVTISSAGENAFLAGQGNCWGGMTDEALEGTWVWCNGEPVVYTSWAAGEPNNSGGAQNYQVLNWGGNNWDDQGTTTTTTFPYIVEIESRNLTMVSGLASGSFFPIGTTTVSYSARDTLGNTSTPCSFTVTVVDNSAPTFTCNANMTVTAAVGACNAVVNYTAPVASDNCASCATPPTLSGMTLLGIRNSRAYYVSNGTSTWTNANVASISQGGYLAAIDDAAENTFIVNAVNTTLGSVPWCWIGMSDSTTEGTFAWSNGQPVTYTNFSPGEPNNSGGVEDYVHISNASGQWNDLGPANTARYILELDCTPVTRTAGPASGSVFPVGTTTVTHQAADGSGNTGICTFTVTVNLNAASINKAVTATPAAICSGSASTITVALSDVGVNYQLRDASNTNVGSPVAGTGGTINLPTGNLTTTTTFNVLATNVSAGCSYSLTNTATVTVNTLPSLPAAGNNSRCAAGTVTITATPGTGETIDWYAAATGGTALLTANTSYTTPSISTTTIYYAQARNTTTGCLAATRTAVTATVNTLPASPTAGNNSRCGTGTVVITATPGAGETVDWYAAATGGTALGTGNTSYTTPSISTTTIYYAESRNTTTGCVSATRTTVTATMLAGAAIPTGVNGSRCGTGPVTITASVGSGSVIDWYAAATGGTALLSSNTSFTTPSITTTTIYYAEARNTTSGCVSATRTAVTATINAQPTDKTITAVSTTICSNTSAIIQVASSTVGVNYQLRNNAGNVNIGSAVVGTGGTINLPSGALTSNTIFNVLATIASSSCSLQMTTTIPISVITTGLWTGGSTGDWNNPSNWCGGIPTSSSNVIIPAGATVNIQSANAVAGSVTIAGTGSLVMTGAHNLTITAGGTFTNNGTFTATSSTGAVVFAGAGTIAGTTSFQNIQTSGALNFGTASTVNGNFTIQTGGSVTGNAPTYTCPSSTLIYRTGGTFARGIEWATNPTGQGYPSNVLVQSNTIINFPIPGQGYVCNDLTIEDGSVLNQNFASGSASLQVGRNVTIAGTLTLGGASGGDLNVGGNWTRTSTGVFNHNERKVTFDGTGNFSGRGLAMSTISAPASSFKDNEGGFGGEKFAHLWMNKAAATDSLVLLSNVTITREIGFTRGTFSLRNSDVTLVSNTTRTADIAPVTTPANVAVRYAGTGRFNIQRFVHNPTAVRSWRLLTAPVEAASAPSINTAWQYGTVNPDRTNPTGADGIYNPWPGYGTHITGPGGTYNLASGFDHGTNSASILQATANVAGWVAPANTKGTLVTDQQGWMLFVRGDRGYAIGSQYTPSQSTTLETRGKVLIGDVVRPVAAGRQVIANPYASAISLANIDLSGTGNTNANVYYTWDPKFFTSYTQPGKWVTFTRAGSTFVSTTSASNYSNTGVIESGQAFVIQPSVAGNVTFKESDKLPLTSSLIGVANRPTNQTFGMLRSDLYVNNGGVFTLTDAVVNLFDEDYTNTVDEEDANKLITFNTKESLSLQRDTSKLAIEKRSKIISTDTIYYSLSKLNELPYQFRFKASNIPVGLTAYVEDKFTNSRTVVNLNGETIVDFTITADPLSKVMDRFKMVFKLQGPLPVKITTLTATKQSNSKVAVDWKVESETNVSSYYIEKSTDGIHFSTVAVENAYGNNTRFATYQWLDTKPFNGRNFYRLKVLDFDGTFTYSQIVQVSFDNKSTISIFPNPIENNTIQVVLNGVSKGNYQVQLYNKAGQLITNTIIVVNATDMMTKIPIASTLAKGIYDAIIISPEGIKTNLKVAVQ